MTAHEPLSLTQRAEYVAKRAELRHLVASVGRDLRNARWLLFTLRVRRDTLSKKIERLGRKGRDVQQLRDEREQAIRHAVDVASLMSSGAEFIAKSKEDLAEIDALLRQ